MSGIVRPERRVLTGEDGLASAIHTARLRTGLTKVALGDIKSACLNDPDRVYRLLIGLRSEAARQVAEVDATARENDSADEAEEMSAPSRVLPIDQAEEMFSADASDETEQFLTLIGHLTKRINVADVGLIVAATIRTDRLEVMQSHPALENIGTVLFDELKPRAEFKDVISGPAAGWRNCQGPVDWGVSGDLRSA